MLSVVITTFNEAANLPRVVASVKSLADEIIVVDTESTDSTVAVAKKLGCKIYHHPNTGVVEPVRNFSISKASGDWVLLLDADEEVPPALAKLIPTLISSEIDYYRLPRKNLIFGSWIRNSHWWPDYVYRLFRKGSIVWSDVIHSIPQTRGTGSDLEATEKHALIHHHYSSISQFIARLDRYTEYQLTDYLASGAKFVPADLVSKPVMEFIRLYFARGGFKDGLHGLALALLLSVSELVFYLKVWQSQGFAGRSLTMGDLESQITTLSRQWQWWSYQAKIDSAPFWQKPFLKLRRRLLGKVI